MAARTVTVVNALGMHARAAARFAHLAGRFHSKVTVEKDGRGVDGKSILGLLLLSASQGSQVVIVVEGPDADVALGALCALVTSGFEEGAGSPATAG